MDFINKHFVEYEYAFYGRLKTVGFTRKETVKFLSETSSQISLTIRDTRLDKVIEILLSDNPDKILLLIDQSIIARNTMLTTPRVNSALKSIYPVIKQIFIVKSNEIVTETASLAWEATKDSIANFEDKTG